MNVEIPQSQWTNRKLGDLAEITLGGTPSTDVPSFWGGQIPWMASGEVNKRHVHEVDGRITKSGLNSSNARLVDPPAVAIGLAGQGKTRGTVALVHIRVCTNQSIALLKGRAGELETGFLFHNLTYRYEELRANSAGGGRAGLSRDILKRLPICLPTSPADQGRIAAVLDAVYTAIAKTAALIAKLKQVRAGLLHDLLTRGLDDNGELRDPFAHPEQFKDSPVSRTPKQWECKLLLDPSVTKWFSGGTPDRSQAAWWSGSVPFLTPKDMKIFEISDTIEHVTDFAAQCGSRLMPAETVFIVVRGMILAHTFPVCLSTRPFAFNQDVKAIRGGSLVSTRFLGHWLAGNANLFLRKATEATHGTKKLDTSEINRVLIACPPIDEQNLLVERIEVADMGISRNQSELHILKQLKVGLMSDLLTGRVVVPEDIAKGATP